MQGEDEQLAALKSWWQKNGTSLVTGVVLALAIVFGWKAYENYTQEAAEAASNRYQMLIQSLATLDPGQDEAVAKVQLQAQELKAEHGGSTYAQYAALVLAKLAVEQGNLDQAEAELRWVLSQKPQAEIERVATARLARVLGEQQRYDDAVALLSVPAEDAFFVYFQEIKGDILRAAGQAEAAREAYQAALDQAGAEGQGAPLLRIKLADLATASQ